MKASEFLDMKGQLTLQKRNAANEVFAEMAALNSIVLSGRDLVAKLFINEKIDPISHIAVGKGTDPIDPVKDETLAAETFRKPITPIDLTQNLTTTSDGKKKVTVTAELDFNEANGALTEAGLFNAATDGVMYNRVVFPEINKTSDFKLTLIWEILF
ncbi:MAG: hypothetical protein WCD18_01855 [Thermosynechococcaceae cyanobacterium]